MTGNSQVIPPGIQFNMPDLSASAMLRLVLQVTAKVVNQAQRLPVAPYRQGKLLSGRPVSPRENVND